MLFEIIVIWNDFDNETEWSNDLQESVERGGSSSPRLDSAFVRGGGAASVIIITDHDHHEQNHHHHYLKTTASVIIIIAVIIIHFILFVRGRGAACIIFLDHTHHYCPYLPLPCHPNHQYIFVCVTIFQIRVKADLSPNKNHFLSFYGHKVSSLKSFGLIINTIQRGTHAIFHCKKWSQFHNRS